MNFDFTKNIEFLTSKKTSKEFELQENILNSDKYNKSFAIIENNLNLLYEKTRTMQDLIQYSNSFIKQEIDDTIIECRTLLSNIESNNDLLKSSAYINYNVNLRSVFDTFSDRNNDLIKGVLYHDGAITLNNFSTEVAMLEDIAIESKSVNNNIFNTVDEISANKSYRTFYMFDRIQKEAVKEKISLKFKKPITINKINLTKSNSKISSIELINEHNKVEILDKYDVNLIHARTVKAVNIFIECNNYIISQINYNEVENDDFWQTINQIKNDDNLLIDKKKYYYYLFGLNDIEISFAKKEKVSCFVSKEFKIDKLKDNEYIALTADYSCVNGNIEFYILDGSNEIPILPEDENKINHEKIFFKIPTLFSVNDINQVQLFEDGIPSKISLNEAINSNKESFTVSYVPKDGKNIGKLTNENIKVKAILRSYKEDIAFIKNIKVKKYGGGSVWTTNTEA